MNTPPAAINQPHWREVLPDLERRLGGDRILVASDFDGTLAPLAPTPDEAAILPASRAALEHLSRLPGVTVAVISSRSLEDVADKVGLPALTYAGNHGVEMRGPDMPLFRLPTDDVRWDLNTAVTLLHSFLDGIAGALVEDKGSSISVHYRQVAPADFDAVAAAVTEAAALSPQIQLKHGKMVWELRPDLGWNKGSAIIRLMAHFKIGAGAVFYLGDDETDDDAFHVIPRGATFLVGDRDAPEAAFRCHSPEDVAALLTWIADQRESLPAGI
jgi:trehalose 6-phosphate phosphatase